MVNTKNSRTAWYIHNTALKPCTITYQSTQGQSGREHALVQDGIGQGDLPRKCHRSVRSRMPAWDGYSGNGALGRVAQGKVAEVSGM